MHAITFEYIRITTCVPGLSSWGRGLGTGLLCSMMCYTFTC